MSETVERTFTRLDSIDFLRSLVMIIMLLDHTREFVHNDAFLFNPTDLSKTNAALFFTRWITHLCAPTFVFLSGTSIYLQMMRGKSRAELAKFLLTRGLWLIFLEFTIIRFAIIFNLDYGFAGLAEVIWIFGVSMIALAGLIFLPVRVVGIIGVLMIALHNLLDGINVPPAVSIAGTPAPDVWQTLWIFLHQPGFVPLSGGAAKIFVAYPLIPWVGVMAAGFWLGSVYQWETARRRAFLLRLGGGLLALFVIVRALNFYGDPLPWTIQDTTVFTILSFINVTKYPVSLLFLLLTLGAALIILALAEKISIANIFARVCITFGRVPLFYFILQMFVAHLFGVVLNYAAGKPVDYLFASFPDSAQAPPGAGFDLWVVYAAWFGGLLILHPLCVWYGRIKQQRRGFPFSYL